VSGEFAMRVEAESVTVTVDFDAEAGRWVNGSESGLLVTSVPPTVA